MDFHDSEASTRKISPQHQLSSAYSANSTQNLNVVSRVALRGARDSQVVFYPRYQTSEVQVVDTMTDFRVNEILSGNLPLEALQSEVG